MEGMEGVSKGGIERGRERGRVLYNSRFSYDNLPILTEISPIAHVALLHTEI